MNRNQVIERYCHLAAEVYHRFGNYGSPNDCICHHKSLRPDAEKYFRCGGEVVDWIEKTVRKALDIELGVLDRQATDSDEGDA